MTVGERSNKSEDRTLLEPSDHISAELRIGQSLEEAPPARLPRRTAVEGDKNKDERVLESIHPPALAHERVSEQFLADQVAPPDRSIASKRARVKHPWPFGGRRSLGEVAHRD